MKAKIFYNGVELTGADFMITADPANVGAIQKIEINHEVEQPERLRHQLEALRWLQSKSSDQFVTAWIGMYHDSLERAGGTPERD